MTEEKRNAEEACSSYKGLDMVCKKWRVDILFQLKDSEGKRFSEIKRDITGISNKVLAQNLRALKENRIVEKKENGLHPRYCLTDKGEELVDALERLVKWGVMYGPESEKKDILIVENDPQLINVYVNWLEAENFRLKIADKEAEVFETLSSEIGIVVIDSDEIDLIEKIEEIWDGKIVLVTEKETVEDLLKGDSHKMLVKPVTRGKLRDAVKER